MKTGASWTAPAEQRGDGAFSRAMMIGKSLPVHFITR
jgi:hypothetical protein